jgi:hypothetical protein
VTEHCIQAVEPLPGHRLMVRWETGDRSVIDFSGDVASAPVWAPLQDERLFAKARVVADGAVVEWPEPVRANGWPNVDVDADGLWAMAERQGALVAAE